jgi:phosphodiesterase/alkaline phosphatase D-like protein
LAGRVDPHCLRTAYYFQWGPSATFGATSALAFVEDRPAEVEVALPAEALAPGTTYHYRLVASNELGTTVGATRTLLVPGSPPPAVETGAARWLSPTAATLGGTISCHGEPAAWYFEYGLSPRYGIRTSGGVAAGDAPEVVTEQIRGLAPGTSCHYRLVVRRRTQVRRGEDRVFMTPPVESLSNRLRASRARRARQPATVV